MDGWQWEFPTSPYGCSPTVPVRRDGATGGKIFPVKGLPENASVLLVAGGSVVARRRTCRESGAANHRKAFSLQIQDSPRGCHGPRPKCLQMGRSGFDMFSLS